MTAITRKILFPAPPAPKVLVNPVAFFIALILAPILVGILGAPLLLIPSFAALFGGVPYILIGGPVLWWALRNGQTEPDRFFGLGFKTIAILTAILVPLSAAWVFQAEGQDQAMSLIGGSLVVALISAVFAGVWGMAFASLYRRLRNPRFPV